MRFFTQRGSGDGDYKEQPDVSAWANGLTDGAVDRSIGTISADEMDKMTGEKKDE